MKYSIPIKPWATLTSILFLLVSISVHAEDNNAVQKDDSQALLQIMEDARIAMFEREYTRAIKLYRQLAEMPDHILRRDAIESLGLAYERAGKLEQAKKTYEMYLQLYPKSDGVERIRQRIAGLETANWEEKKKLAKPEPTSRKDQWRNYGSWAQYARRNASIYEDENEVVDLNLLSSFLDANSRGKLGSVDIKTRFSGSHNADLNNENNNYEQLSYLYAEVNQRSHGIYTRLGRQRPKGGGVLGRFDGINLGYHLNNSLIVNLTGGMPVDRTTHIYLDDSKYFYGLNLETGPWNKYWLANTYVIRQYAESLLDREAVGGELRFVHPKHSLYTLVDYDLYFDMLNIFSTQGSWSATESTTFNVFVDYRHSPSLSTRNALQGQPVFTLSDLKTLYSEEEIHQLAIDRSAKYYMAMAAVTYKFNDTYQLDTDVTATNLVATPSSGGVAGSNGTPNEYYFSTRLTVSNIFQHKDVNIIALRYADTNNSVQKSIMLNSRFNAAGKWFINPSLFISRTTYTASMQKSDNNITPGLRAEYQPSRALTLEFEAIPQWNKRRDTLGNAEYKNYYVSAGYRYIFD